MGNKDWENYLRDILGDFKSEGETPRWDEFEKQHDPGGDPSDLPENLQDEALKESLSNYSPDQQIAGWERIAASLDAADREFDEQVRRKINQYQPADDPHSWAAFMTRFSAHKMLRAKLIALKVFETAAMLLLIVTIFHLGQQGKLPFYNPSSPDLASTGAEARAVDTDPAAKQNLVKPEIVQETVTPGVAKNNTTRKPSSPKAQDISLTKASAQAIQDLQIAGSSENAPVSFSSEVVAIDDQDEMEVAATATGHTPAMDATATTNLPARDLNYMQQTPSLPVAAIDINTIHVVPDPVFISALQRSYLEFGMLVQADYNQLKIPEDRVNSDGKQVIFPLQGITSPGYGAGFTLAYRHARLALETGIIYNSKSFRPGRELSVGAGQDRGNVEYEAMRMQLVSAPLQARYTFEPKGRLKSYAIAGFGLHLIVQSDIDVMVQYNFPSLTEGEDPNNVPSLARTIRQTQRVSEDIRKKAPFSTQSYISANLGAGVEYLLDERKTLFLQTAYQYQIPNLRFSNHDGKHLLTLSFQAGVRTPLGN